MKQLIFPDGFLWGASTSSHQIEGGQHNNWSEWECGAKRCEALSKDGQNPEAFKSGLACNTWEMMDDDIACLKQINASAYRFSLEWSRIEPRDGEYDQVALDKYRCFCQKLLSQGIKPFVTIWHWTLPVCLEEKGGWKNSSTPKRFALLAEKVAQSMPEVEHWITINEPEIFSANSFLRGLWPPQENSVYAYLRVWHNLAKAHKLAYSRIKSVNPALSVGISKNNVHFEPVGQSPLNRLLAVLAHAWVNDYFLFLISGRQDFIGLNHYFHNRVDKGFSRNLNKRTSDMGWELYPESLYWVLLDLKKYGLPVYITENGLADELDKQREWFLRESLKQARRAIADGVDLRGYFHWSLLDNFEWAHGFGPKFGLFAVDKDNFCRTPRPSVKAYAQISKDNMLQE